MIDGRHDRMGLSKILIVDDDYTDIRYLNHLLREPLYPLAKDSYEIRSADTALNGLDTWRAWSPDCILLDYNLPDMNGLQFMEEINIGQTNIERLSSEAFSNPLAIVMLTGFGDESTAVQAMKLGISDYLVKGQFTGLELTQTIHKAYEKAELLFELEQRQNELALFADRLAHDMVTPLHSIGLHVELLEELLVEYDVNPRIMRNLETIDDITIQLSDFVQHLYDYTTIGRTAVSFESVDLTEVVQQAFKLLQPELEAKNVIVEQHDLPKVRGHSVDLIQLFQNIISNAIKYNDKTTPQIEFSAERVNKEFWKITVSDNGIGIHPEECEIIFEPFKRTPAAHKYQGSGLGLSTCHKIIEKHGGKIWAESKIGCGMSIHFLLLAHNDFSSFVL